MNLLYGALVFLAALMPMQVPAATILKNDFNHKGWPGAAAVCFPSSISARAALRPVGTVDVANTAQASGAITLIADHVPGRGAWRAELKSGLLPIQNTEADSRKLTLAFTLAASDSNPVCVRIESFDARRHRTGGLTGWIYPAAPNFPQRYALDLPTLKHFGSGKFTPKSPFVQFTFGGAGQADTVKNSSIHQYQLIVDNINYSSPAYYVSPKGSDNNDGRTEKTAFATPQKALNVAGPGDIILLMDGTYREGQMPVASFVRPGQPDAWIVLKNYPGQHPTLTSTGWNIISIAKGSREQFSHDPALAYLEMRGLHIRGEGDVARQKYREFIDKPDSRTNTNGISIDDRYMINMSHDIRIADNLVEFCTANGIGGGADWFTIENNVCRSNSWTTIYAASGISVAGGNNFDTVPNVYKRLIRNNVCYRNQTFQPWADMKRYSDGNGIILDINQGIAFNKENGTTGTTDAHAPSNYIGRTLVQSNLCYDNGGSGIHTVTADHVDIVNNTVYLNSASPHLEYSELFTYSSKDVHFWNNIAVAPVANTAAGEKPEPVNVCAGTNSDVTFSHNVYFGGNVAPTMGDGDVVADPQLVRPSRDGLIADFHLKPGSPAVKTGMVTPFLPYRDPDGVLRLPKPSRGAYQK